MEGTTNSHSQEHNQHHAAKEENNNNNGTPVKLDYVVVKTAAMTLRAINHKLRQGIVKLLEENKRMNVTDIYVKLRLEQSVASQHLAILRRAQIVITEREGKFIHYSLNHARIAEISRFVTELVSTSENHSKGNVRARQEDAATAQQPAAAQEEAA